MLTLHNKLNMYIGYVVASIDGKLSVQIQETNVKTKHRDTDLKS